MALIKIKQINNSTASSGDVITYNGTNNVWAPGGSGVTTFQITGSDAATSEPMAFVTDITRTNKVLSVESNELSFMHDAPNNNSWFRPGDKRIDSALNGYIMPYDGTVVRMSAHCADVKSNTKNLSVYISTVETTSVITLTGAGEDQDETTNVNIDFSAGDKIRVRARNGSGGRMKETIASVWIKWRKV